MVAIDDAFVVEQQDPHRAPVRSAIVIPIGSDGQGGDGLRIGGAVEIAQARECDAEKVAVTEFTGEAAVEIANFLVMFDGSVVIKKQDPDRAPIRSARVVLGSDGEVGYAVAVEIAQVRYGTSKFVFILKFAGEAAFGGADLLRAFDGAVVVEKQDPHGPAIDDSSIVILDSADGEVGDAVAVEIAQVCYGPAQIVQVFEPSDKIAFGGAYFLKRLNLCAGDGRSQQAKQQ